MQKGMQKGMQKVKDSYTVKGSYTVEAACICPLAIFLVVFIWYLGFCQHNRIVCQAICREAVYKGLDAVRDDRDAEAAVQEVLNSQTVHLFGTENVRTEYSVSDKEIFAAMQVRMRIPFGLGLGLEEDTLLLEEEAKLSAEHPVTVIRRLRRLRELMGS